MRIYNCPKLTDIAVSNTPIPAINESNDDDDDDVPFCDVEEFNKLAGSSVYAGMMKPKPPKSC